MTPDTLDIIFICIISYTYVGLLTIAVRAITKDIVLAPQQLIFNMLCWPLVWVVLILAWAVDKIEGQINK